MKTTNEGFLVNTLRRIPRHGVKALAAGALLIAAALPLAVASSAGATTAPTLTGVTSITTTAPGSQTAGTSFGAGASGVITLSGTGFAYDGGNVSVASSATGVTFSGAHETNATTVVANYSSTTSVAPGTYSVTVTDDYGTSNTVPNAFTVIADPAIATVAPITPASLSDGNPATSVSVSGSGFETSPDTGATDTNAEPTVTLTSTVNGTQLTTGTVTNTGTGTLTFNVTPTQKVGGAAATPGTYNLTVVNPDGGSVTDAGIFTITAYGITNVSPSALPYNTSGATVDYFLTVTGTGFEYGATVAISGVSAECTSLNANLLSANVTSATTIALEVGEVTATNAMAECTVTVTNPGTNVGGNAATYQLAGSLAIGEAATVAPTVTGATTSAALTAGGVPATTTITGSGFSQYSTVSYYPGTSTTASTNVTAPYVAGNTGTTLSASVSATSGAVAGPYSITVSGSSPFAAAATVTGPVITSQTPLVVNAPVGTVVTLTGTGFTNTDTGTYTTNGAGYLHGFISYVSPTTLNFVVTTPAAAPNDITTAPTVTVVQNVGGVLTDSPAFKLIVSPAPTVSGLVYPTGAPSDVGVGAVAYPVTITGTGFATGVTIGGFVNGGGIADPDVTAAVTGVNAAGTAISANITITSGDANIADGYTVTNANGGVVKVSAVNTAAALVIGAGPTITSITPATSPASTTTSFTIVGTNFESGAIVQATADGTCGTATPTNSTTLTVSCTFGAATSTAAALQVVNPDGGTATSATIIAAATAPAAPAPHATGEAGNAVVGKTVAIAVGGVGFYGQPKVTSTGASVKAVVSKDTGTLLTVQVTVGTTTGPGEHTLTFTLANGKVFKVNYLIIK